MLSVNEFRFVVLPIKLKTISKFSRVHSVHTIAVILYKYDAAAAAADTYDQYMLLHNRVIYYAKVPRLLSGTNCIIVVSDNRIAKKNNNYKIITSTREKPEVNEISLKL